MPFRRDEGVPTGPTRCCQRASPVSLAPSSDAWPPGNEKASEAHGNPTRRCEGHLLLRERTSLSPVAHEVPSAAPERGEYTTCRQDIDHPPSHNKGGRWPRRLCVECDARMGERAAGETSRRALERQFVGLRSRSPTTRGGRRDGRSEEPGTTWPASHLRSRGTQRSRSGRRTACRCSCRSPAAPGG